MPRPAADGAVPYAKALRLSSSVWVNVILTRVSQGRFPRPDARVFCRFGDWFAVVTFPARRGDPGSQSLVLALRESPLA